MEGQVPGAMGSSGSLALRFGQTCFSCASLLFMCLDVEFYSYTTFCFLVTVMGLVIPWSLVLVLADAYSVFVKSLDLQRRNLLMIIIGDLVLSFLSLAAACSTASVADLLLDVGKSFCPAKLCSRYQLSAAMAFLSWFLTFSSSLFNLWLLPAL
uniref:CASP-like protein n=1 Tax=Populus davidiana TaxID=266767 RepID=A0A6M2EHL5_9ROSI